jgi:predicted RND superfamily exporter protein
MSGFVSEIYKNWILGYPKFTLFLIILTTLFFSYYIKDFHLDASSDTLVLQGNQSLEYYREIKRKYGSDDYLIVTFKPKKAELFSNDSLQRLKSLQNDLSLIDRVGSITSILNAPLIESPAINFNELSNRPVSIENNNFSNLKDVKQELTNSPIYQNTIISKKGDLAALLVNFKDVKVSQEQERKDIAEARSITEKYKDFADIYIGGVPMIVADSIDFIASDIKVFGSSLILFLAVLLAISFRKMKWVIIPLSNCIITCLITIGLLGLLDWPVTVVSSNFISLLLIISLSLSIHYIVRYEEYINDGWNAPHSELIFSTAKAKFLPCFYTAITTIVAFSSLIVSDIKPVIDFGWMMVVGIAISFIVTFTFIPSALCLLKLDKTAKKISFHKLITSNLYNLTNKTGILIILGFTVISLTGIYGITKLSVQNRFIDYYKDSTEIYQGMKIIDEELGGTTPLEVVIDAPENFMEDEYFEPKDYWYNSFMIEELSGIHDYLDSLPETGKVLSLYSAMQMLSKLNDNNQIDSFLLGLVDKKLPEDIRGMLVSPYLSKDGNQIVISTRVYESHNGLDRERLINKIHHDISNKFDIEAANIHITGMVVLYNDLLQSLFKSQIMTLGIVFLAIAMMFALLFKNFKMALIAITANIIPAVIVLGVMGLAGISLDIMTITIAAICVGIAVDDTIHYVHRFTEEFEKDSDYWKSVKRAHNTIGTAIYLTTITITLGFSILALSNFVPTIYFGLLTGLSMVIALIADLTLLPLLIAKFKPLGKKT